MRSDIVLKIKSQPTQRVAMIIARRCYTHCDLESVVATDMQTVQDDPLAMGLARHPYPAA